MTGLTAERVHAASAGVFLPPSAPRVETDEYLLIRYPDWFERPVQLVRFEPRRAAPEVLAEVIDQARQYVDPANPATAQISCWVRLDSGATVETSYVDAGGVLDESVDVLAMDVADFDPAVLDPATDVEVRWSDDLAVMIDAAELGAEVFGGTASDREALAAEHVGEVVKYRSGGGGAAVAYLDGRPVGSGGLTVVDGTDARFWGGAVRPEMRGRGIYRSVLAARLAYARDADADLALVKGRVQTSGPILRRAGFEAFGQERAYVIDLA